MKFCVPQQDFKSWVTNNHLLVFLTTCIQWDLNLSFCSFNTPEWALLCVYTCMLMGMCVPLCVSACVCLHVCVFCICKYMSVCVCTIQRFNPAHGRTVSTSPSSSTIALPFHQSTINPFCPQEEYPELNSSHLGIRGQQYGKQTVRPNFSLSTTFKWKQRYRPFVLYVNVRLSPHIFKTILSMDALDAYNALKKC